MHSPHYSQQHSRKTSSSKNNNSIQKLKNLSDLNTNFNLNLNTNNNSNNIKNLSNIEINNIINKRNNIPSNIINYKTISNSYSKNNNNNNNSYNIRINKGNRSPFRTLQNTPKSSIINTPNSLHRHPSYNRTINSTIYSNLIKNSNIENSPSILSPNNNKIIKSNHIINNSNLQL